MFEQAGNTPVIKHVIEVADADNTEHGLDATVITVISL